jgi:hypothetical protein
VDSFEMSYIRVAEGSIRSDVDVTLLTMIGARLSFSGSPQLVIHPTGSKDLKQ